MKSITKALASTVLLLLVFAVLAPSDEVSAYQTSCSSGEYQVTGRIKHRDRSLTSIGADRYYVRLADEDDSPDTVMEMDAQLRKCSWWFFICLRTSHVQDLSVRSYAGPGYWSLPASGFYYSNPLQPDRYIVKTTHTVSFVVGSNTGFSTSGWITIP